MSSQRRVRIGVFVVAAALFVGLLWSVRLPSVAGQDGNDVAAVSLEVDSAPVYLPLIVTAPVTPTFPVSAMAVVDSNVRSCASVMCSIIDGLVLGEVVTVVACNVDCSWYQLDSGGWVFAVLLRLLP